MSTPSQPSNIKKYQQQIEKAEDELKNLHQSLENSQDILRRSNIYRTTLQENLHGQRMITQKAEEATLSYGFGAAFVEDLQQTGKDFYNKTEESLSNIQFNVNRRILETEDQICDKKNELENLQDELHYETVRQNNLEKEKRTP